MKNQENKAELTISIKEDKGVIVKAEGGSGDLINYMINAIHAIFDTANKIKLPDEVFREAVKMDILRHCVEESGVDFDIFVEGTREVYAHKEEKKKSKETSKKKVEKEEPENAVEALNKLFKEISKTLFGGESEED